MAEAAAVTEVAATAWAQDMAPPVAAAEEAASVLLVVEVLEEAVAAAPTAVEAEGCLAVMVGRATAIHLLLEVLAEAVEEAEVTGTAAKVS